VRTEKEIKERLKFYLVLRERVPESGTFDRQREMLVEKIEALRWVLDEGAGSPESWPGVCRNCARPKSAHGGFARCPGGRSQYEDGGVGSPAKDR